MSKRLKLVLLIAPPLLVIAVFMIGDQADKAQRRRLDREHSACVATCKAVEASDYHTTDSATGRRKLTPAAFECMGLGRDLGTDHVYDFGDGCVRGEATDYVPMIVLAGGLIGIPWAAWAAWLLVLAMIRSVVRAIRDASR